MVSTIKALKEAQRLVKDFKTEAAKIDGEFKAVSALDKLIIMQWEKFSIPQLEALRYNLNKVIKRKKELKRQKEAKHV